MVWAAPLVKELCDCEGGFPSLSSPLPSLRLRPFRPARRGLPLVALVAGGLVGLGATNPDGQAFESFAAERLTALLIEELCSTDGLPMLARLVIHDCPGLVTSQRGVLGRLALGHTQRRNLGVMSVYHTELGGQSLLGVVEVPRYSATTLGVAGRFVILSSGEGGSGEIRR